MPINISTSAAIFAWSPAAWLRVTGEDAATFLQGQFTNDLRALAQEAAIYGLWLNVKGKVVADSFVLRGQNGKEFWIGSLFSAAAAIRGRLESHVIADDVVIEDFTGEWAGISLLDAEANGPAAALSIANAFLFRGRRDRGAGVECVYRISDGVPAVLANWPGPRIDASAIERRRIAAGIPAIPIDIGSGDLPNEGGLEADAISYAKGCYLGQEVMARLKSMGQVRRRLLRVQGAGEINSPMPAPLLAGARQVGEVRSAARDGAGNWIGLAMVSLLQVNPDTMLSLKADGAPSVRLLDSP